MSAYFLGENKLTTVQYFFRIDNAGEGMSISYEFEVTPHDF